MSDTGGRQSPKPEDQDPRQGTEAPSKGAGEQENQTGDNKESSKQDLEGLESNPKHILEDAAKDKVSKTT